MTKRSVKTICRMSPKTSEQFDKIRQESRTRIMVSALELFAIDGYHNTSISNIAKHAGISKGLMYNYFDSKEELLEHVVIMAIDDAKEEGLTILNRLRDKSPSEILAALFDSIFNMMNTNTTMWKLSFSLAIQVSNIPSISALITRIFREVFEHIEYILKLNDFPNYKQEAKLLTAQLDGIFLHSVVFGKAYDLEAIKTSLIEKYCHNKR